MYACLKRIGLLVFRQYAVPTGVNPTPVKKSVRRSGDRNFDRKFKKALEEGATAALRRVAESLRDEVEYEFWGQVIDRKRITDEERKAVAAQGFDIDELAEEYRDKIQVIQTDKGFKVGFPEGETLVHAGRVFEMTELATLFELGTDTVAQRAHWVPVWQRFKTRYPEVSKDIQIAVQERLE